MDSSDHQTYVWHLPFLAAAGLTTALAALICTLLLLAVRRRARTSTARALWSAALAIVLLASPALTALVGRILSVRREDLLPEAALLVGWCSAAVGASVAGTAGLLFPDGPRRNAAKWRGAFVVIVAFFAVANLANGCQLGRCVRFGFPFVYQSWNDVPVFDALPMGGFSTVAFLGDLLVLFAVGWGLAFAYRRDLSDPRANLQSGAGG